MKAGMGYSFPFNVAARIRTPRISACTRKSVARRLRLQERGARFYSAILARWINRDPIGERGGRNLYTFVKNEPAAHTDGLGQMGNAPPGVVTKGCCGSKGYDLSTECCCKDKVYSKAMKPSGIKRCCAHDWTGVIPDHCWIEWPGGSAGLYPDASAPFGGLWGSPGIVAFPESYVPVDKQCTEFQLSDCVCNITAVKACVADVASKHANGTWLPPTYNFGVFDCRHYPSYLVSGCCSAVGCGGSWPPPSTISPW
jgi:RHS repeat-associated protein